MYTNFEDSCTPFSTEMKVSLFAVLALAVAMLHATHAAPSAKTSSNHLLVDLSDGTDTANIDGNGYLEVAVKSTVASEIRNLTAATDTVTVVATDLDVRALSSGTDSVTVTATDLDVRALTSTDVVTVQGITDAVTTEDPDAVNAKNAKAFTFFYEDADISDGLTSLYEAGNLIDAGTSATIVSSSTADDDTTGAGAWTVFITGIDNSTRARVTETAIMDGQTPVALSNTYWRIESAHVVKSGTFGQANTGTITISSTPAAQVMLTIPAGEGRGYSGFYTVPASTVGVVKHIQFSAHPNSPAYDNPVKFVVAIGKYTDDGGTYHLAMQTHFKIKVLDDHVTYPLSTPLVLAPGDSLVVVASNENGSGEQCDVDYNVGIVEIAA